MTNRELRDFEILHLEQALAALKARPDTGDPDERTAVESDLTALYERRGEGPGPSNSPGHLTQEQAQKNAEDLNRRAQRRGLRKKYVVISTCTMGLVVAERCKL